MLGVKIKVGHETPTVVDVRGNTTFKPLSSYTANERTHLKNEGKAPNLLYNALSKFEHMRVMHYDTTKDIWDPLQVTHEDMFHLQI